MGKLENFDLSTEMLDAEEVYDLLSRIRVNPLSGKVYTSENTIFDLLRDVISALGGVCDFGVGGNTPIPIPSGDIDVPSGNIDIPPSGDIDVPSGDIDIPSSDIYVPSGDIDVPPSGDVDPTIQEPEVPLDDSAYVVDTSDWDDDDDLYDLLAELGGLQEGDMS